VVAFALSAMPTGGLGPAADRHQVQPRRGNDTPKGLAAEFFAKRAGELTKGKVKVEVYANSTLYKDKEEMEALQLGAVQMLAPSLAKFGPLGVKEFELFDLPYIFDNYADLHKVTQGPISGKSLLKKLEPKGVVGLAFWDNGFKSFSANTPILMPADLKGKKMRIQSSKVLEAQMRALSATAPGDGLLRGLSGAADRRRRWHREPDLQPLHAEDLRSAEASGLTEHGYLGYAVIANKKFWDGLPADVRGQLETAMKESTDYANKIAKEQNDKDLEAVKKSGKTQVTCRRRRAHGLQEGAGAGA
jgi:C4-dicarboxylate-binding protein DctP